MKLSEAKEILRNKGYKLIKENSNDTNDENVKSICKKYGYSVRSGQSGTYSAPSWNITHKDFPMIEDAPMFDELIAELETLDDVKIYVDDNYCRVYNSNFMRQDSLPKNDSAKIKNLKIKLYNDVSDKLESDDLEDMDMSQVLDNTNEWLDNELEQCLEDDMSYDEIFDLLYTNVTEYGGPYGL